MQLSVFRLIWNGIWQGIGLEVSFFLPWLGWHFLYKKTAHRFDPEHIFHIIHDYFVN